MPSLYEILKVMQSHATQGFHRRRGLVLSPRAQSKVRAKGNNNSERICWVRLEGPACNLFVVAVYVPHNSRVCPSQQDTLRELDEVCKQAKQGDCIVVLGDFNVQLPGGVQGHTGPHVCAQGESESATEVINFMRQYDLSAMNTKFRKSKTSPATYMHVVSSDATDVNDQYVGREVKETWKGSTLFGHVVENLQGAQGGRRWKAKFSDGYVKTYSEKELLKALVVVKKKTEGRQLDYILVSNRWTSSVQDAGVRWGPSEHRNIGGRADHALVYCRWTWRLQVHKPEPRKDFGALNPRTAEGKKLIANFNEAIKEKLQELPPAETSDQKYSNLCAAVTHAMETTLPEKQGWASTKRTVSKRTKALFNRRTEMGRSKKKYSKNDYDEVQAQIRKSSMQDYHDWVEACAQGMKEANDVGDTKAVYHAVKTLSGKKDKKPPVDLSINTETGKAIADAEEKASVWYTFLKKKFAATKREQTQRPAMTTLPGNKISRDEVEQAVKNMKKHKAVGADGIPVEVYQTSAEAFELLFDLLTCIWTSEQVPTQLSVAVFKMLFKHKGSPDDPSKYRCIGLLNSAYKVLSAVMLQRLIKETQHYLQDWQAGFRQQRGCRDNVMILRTLVSKALREGTPLILTFIDYAAAFDSVSHKFIDATLGDAKAKPKTRALFRSIYGGATARTKVKGVDGKEVFSEDFPIRRGVIQGDITSPWYFILALEAILREHDKDPCKGVPFRSATIHTLGYADDCALVDSSADMATKRTTSIAQGSSDDADMEINVKKTKCMHVRRQQKVAAPDRKAAEKVCKFTCKNVGCGWFFGSKHGLKVHKGRWCNWQRYYEVEKILDIEYDQLPVGLGKAKFLVKWKNYDHSHNEWVEYDRVTKPAILEYLKANGKYDHAWAHRCEVCDKPCRSSHGVKIHYAAKCKDKTKCQHYEGTVAAQLHREAVLTEEQEKEEKAFCQGRPLENVFSFRYLGSMFTADGREDKDIKRRIGMAVTRCGQLRFVLGSKTISAKTKLKIYKCAVGSLFTYGSEAWCLSDKQLRKLNGANAGCLSRFTGKTRVEEAREATTTYSLCKDVRRRRLIWLGHILRMSDVPVRRLVKLAIEEQFETQEGGNMLMDAPRTDTFAELEAMAADRDYWKGIVRAKFGEEKERPPPQRLSIRATFKVNVLPSKKQKNSKQHPPKSKYQQRDEWMMFFHCDNKNRPKRQNKKKKKKKTRPWTNKERQAFARAHWEANHGAAAAAAAAKTAAKTLINKALAMVFSNDSETSLEVSQNEARDNDSSGLDDMGFVPKQFNSDNLFDKQKQQLQPMQPTLNFSPDAPTFIPTTTTDSSASVSAEDCTTAPSTEGVNDMIRRQTIRRLHEMRQAKLRRRKKQKHLPPSTAAASTTTTTKTMTLSPESPSFTPTRTNNSELWAEAAQPPTPTPTSIHFTPSSTSSLWAEPAPPLSPTPSTINLTHTTPNPSKVFTPYNTPCHSNPNHPDTPTAVFNTWSPISPIPICYEPNSPSMNDTYIHTPNNHVLNELPQNLTIMNDTYLTYNFYKL